MRQNRKVSRKRSIIGMHVVHFGVIMLMFGVMAVLHLLVTSSCGQVMKSIGEKERLIQARQNELESARAAWRRATSTDNIARMLHRRGIEMIDPQSDNVIHFDQNGRIDPRERSVALVRERQKILQTASVAQPVARRR